MTHSSTVKLHGRRRIIVRRHHFHHESQFLKCVIAVRAEYNISYILDDTLLVVVWLVSILNESLGIRETSAVFDTGLVR